MKDLLQKQTDKVASQVSHFKTCIHINVVDKAIVHYNKEISEIADRVIESWKVQNNINNLINENNIQLFNQNQKMKAALGYSSADLEDS